MNQIKIATFCIVLFCFGLSLPHAAQQLSDIYLLREKAKSGDAEASFQLGVIYEEGKLDKANPKKAFKYYEEAAKSGLEKAEIALGKAYLQGMGTEKDAKKAIDWFEKAAQKGNPAAYFSIGETFQNGNGIEKDENKAIRSFLNAWNLGHPEAEAKLISLPLKDYPEKQDLIFIAFTTMMGISEGEHATAQKYQQGNGVEKDIQKAIDFYQKAAEKGYLPSIMALAEIYQSGKEVPQNLRLTVKYLVDAALHGDASAEKKLDAIDLEKWGNPSSIDFLKYTAEKKGIANSQFILGKKYLFGDKGIQKNAILGLEWLQKAAIQDYAPAINFLGKTYESGNVDGVEQDLSVAYKWFRKSAYIGNDSAQYVLGTFFEEGKGVEKDDAKAIRWYLKAANLGVKDADLRLAKYTNVGIKKFIDEYDLEFVKYRARNGNTDAMLLLAKYFMKVDEADAVFWLNRLNEEQGNQEAYHLLGEIYLEGKCKQTKDPVQAYNFFKKAKELGDYSAGKIIATMYADSLLQAPTPLQFAESEMLEYLQRLRNDAAGAEEIGESHYFLGELAQRSDSPEKVISYLNTFITSVTTDTNPAKLYQAYFWIGEAQQTLKKHEEAANAFAKAVQILDKAKNHPDIKGFYNSLKARSLYHQGINALEFSNLFKACELLQQAKAMGAQIPEEIRKKCTGN